MNKVNIVNTKPVNDNIIALRNNHERNVISLSEYRERIKSEINTDKNPLPPCALAEAA